MFDPYLYVPGSYKRHRKLRNISKYIKKLPHFNLAHDNYIYNTYFYLSA
jgi:hypothetical protein